MAGLRSNFEVLAALLIALFWVAPVAAQENLISEVAIFPRNTDDVWPRNFIDGDEFGCASFIRFGNWKVTPKDDHGGRDIYWIILENYGVFHCAYLYGTTGDFDKISTTDRSISFIIPLGQTRTDQGMRRLYALSVGLGGPSRYLLFDTPDTKAAVWEFQILDPVCPRGALRQGKQYDIWSSRSCMVDSISMLRRMAISASRRPPAATATLMPETEDQEPAPIPRQDGNR